MRSVFPLGGRPGDTVEVEMKGRNLDGTRAITFARPDIQAQVLSSEFFSLRARITIGPKTPVGLQDFRLRTARGTHVGVFHIGSLPELREAEPNNDLAHAQAIQLPAMIDGTIEGTDYYDVYRFHAEAGETLIFDLLATRAGSRFDGALGVLDERGNELDFADDSYIHKDAFLAFTPQRGGDYFIRVSATQEGRSNGSYRLAAGAIPYMRHVLPVGARRGTTGEFQLAGLNLGSIDRLALDDGMQTIAEGKVLSARPDLLTFRLSVPPSVKPGRYRLHVFAGSLEAPLPIPMLVTDLDEKLSTPARLRSQAQEVAVPVALSGVLDRRKTEHFFSFDVKPGERLTFDVDAMKLGFLVDPVIGIYTSDGQLLDFADDRLQQNGNQPPNLDPYLVHTFEKGGRYVLMIRDSAERGSPNYVYHLAIEKIEPDFELRTQTADETWYRGKTSLAPARVRRNGGWNTPVEVWAENLPTGVTADKVVAEPKDTILKDNCALNRRMDGTDVLVPIHVGPEVKPGVYPILLRARGTMNGKTVEHTAEVFYQWESVGKITGPITEQKLLATVTTLPPVVLEPPDTVTLKAGKQARVRVLVQRFDGGKTPLTLEPEPALPGVKVENNVAQPGASQVVELRLTAAGAVKPGWFRLRAGAAVSPPIELKREKDETAK
ncbi:MAG TPA: PPC domain-containing protein [Bryobacterales bacterium]|nr:PPC domain-containing protein [Bryobacterales bacterium]